MNLVVKIFVFLNPLAPLRQLSAHQLLWKNLLKRRLSQAYHGSLLGGLWSVIQPLFMLLVYTYVFREVFKVRWNAAADASDSMFAIIMFCGLGFFNILSEAVNASAGVMLANVNFIKKTVFPLELLPLTQSCGAAILGGLWFLIIFLANVLVNGRAAFSWTLLLFPVIFLFFVQFVSGICWIVASLGVYFRDTPFICSMVLQVLFFTTPIFYPVIAVPERFRWILNINPVSWFVNTGRQVLLYGELPPFSSWVVLGGLAIVFWQVGWSWFHATGKGFADVL